jgi:hypothetical protein
MSTIQSVEVGSLSLVMHLRCTQGINIIVLDHMVSYSIQSKRSF